MLRFKAFEGLLVGIWVGGEVGLEFVLEAVAALASDYVDSEELVDWEESFSDGLGLDLG